MMRYCWTSDSLVSTVTVVSPWHTKFYELALFYTFFSEARWSQGKKPVEGRFFFFFSYYSLHIHAVLGIQKWNFLGLNFLLFNEGYNFVVFFFLTKGIVRPRNWGWVRRGMRPWRTEDQRKGGSVLCPWFVCPHIIEVGGWRGRASGQRVNCSEFNLEKGNCY